MRVLFSHKLIAISKPRCGSTSVRRFLDPWIDKSKGDIAVDIADQRQRFHPHITAPSLRTLLGEQGANFDDFKSFVVIRHPVAMLWSYYKFFRPDSTSQYSFSPGWEGQIGMSFEDWVLKGKVGMNRAWRDLAPVWISTANLSPLSLEAHVQDVNQQTLVGKIFQLEDMDKLATWIRDITQGAKPMPHVNRSEIKDAPPLGIAATEKMKVMFPSETQFYRI